MKRLTFWLPAVAWAALIFWLSARSHLPDIGPQFPLKDKVGHWMLFGVLGIAVTFALRRGHGLALPKTLLLAILLTSAYGASDEFHQRFVPHRTCDVWDWAADTSGGALLAAACLTYESRRSPKANR